MEIKSFKEWLCTTKNLTANSAKDVVSRVKRSNIYVDLAQGLTVEELIFRMSQNAEFKTLSISVKSQLKRAVKLFKEYELQ